MYRAGIDKPGGVPYGGGVAFSCDPESHAHLDRIVVDAGALLAALIDRPGERTTIPGLAGDREASRRLEFTVRGHEVQLGACTGTGRTWDVAVGFDDFQDAPEEASDPACAVTAAAAHR